MADYFLDTTVMIDHLRGKKGVSSFLESLAERGERVGSCCVNIAEIFAGMREHEREQTGRFLNTLYYYEITREIAQYAGELKRAYSKKGLTLPLSDALVGATAFMYQAVLITDDKKHYPVPELKILQAPR